jgi:pyruvate formate lyase activating enzyme
MVKIFGTTIGSTRDGPGIRYVVYFKGCNFRCLYCGNPESWTFDKSLMIYEDRLKNLGKINGMCSLGALYQNQDGYFVDRSICDTCSSFKCVDHYYNDAISVVGENKTIDAIIDDVLHYRSFYGKKGGVTLSGGEPSLQWDFFMKLLKELKDQGIHTAVETNGSSPRLVYALDNIDLVICDLKHMDSEEHKKLTGASNIQTLANIKMICEVNKPIWVRIPIIPSINDSKENIMKAAEFLAHMKDKLSVELIPYNRLGVYKWKALNQRYLLEHIEPPTNEKMTHLIRIMENNCLKIVRT